MVGFFRWLLGWSELKLEGITSEFLSKYKQFVWKVQKRGKIVFVNCMTKDYIYLKENSVKCGCFVTRVKNAGFLNFLKEYKFRFGLVIGSILFLLMMLISSLFVWDIEIFGNALVSDEQIFKICDKNGLHFGSSIFKVNEKDIEYKIKEKFPEISWISINRIAGKYLIEISEMKEKPNIIDWQGPCDVASDFDGEILYIEAYRGTPVVDVGDIVKKGQILVTGVQEMKGMENLIYTPSDAKIIAKVEHHNEVFLKKYSEINQKTGIKKFDKKLNLFGLNIPLTINRKNENTVKSGENYKPLEFLGLRFPILIKTISYDVYEPINLKNDVSNIKRILTKDQIDWEIKNLVGKKILNRKYNFKETRDGVRLKADVVVEQRVDKKVPIQVEDVEEEKETLEKHKNIS